MKKFSTSKNFNINLLKLIRYNSWILFVFIIKLQKQFIALIIETPKSYKPFFSIKAFLKSRDSLFFFKNSIQITKIFINFIVSFKCFSDSLDSIVIIFFSLIECSTLFSNSVVYNNGPKILLFSESIFWIRTNFTKKFKIKLLIAKGKFSFIIIEDISYFSLIKKESSSKFK